MRKNPKKLITPTGFWVCNDGTQYKFDSSLAEALTSFFTTQNAKVLDLGCGNGAYVNYMREHGAQALGCDGNPHTPEIAGRYCGVCDLTEPQQMNMADWILCLEVAEHIPVDLEPGLIYNIHNHNRKGIVLSWAIPGQGGHGHVNERANEYAKQIFAEEYNYNEFMSEKLRQSASLPWFKNTIMVFDRIEPTTEITPAIHMQIQLEPPKPVPDMFHLQI